MAELAGALCHEVNNTLAAVTLQLEMLTEETLATAAARESVSMLEVAAQQGLGLVRRVRDFARLSRPLVPRPVDLRAVVGDAVASLRARRERLPRVQLTVDRRAVPLVLGNAAELACAVGELVANALDAVGDAGTVRVVTGATGAFVWCRVVDDGKGVSPEVEGRVFDPFVSTRSERGRGLGLTIALAVAMRHEGELTLSGVSPRGAVATLRVPRAR
jgi:signal transduction histidine kinase